MQSPAFKATAKARWAALKPKLSQLDSFIDTTADKIRESSEVNITMWPISGTKPNGDESMTFDQAVARMKQALHHRISEVDTAINAL